MTYPKVYPLGQATTTKPVAEVKTCSTCPHFNNYHQLNARGWCELFNHQVRKHHTITNDCVQSSNLITSHELADNLDIFPDVDSEQLEAFPTDEIKDELDIPHSPYQVGNIVKVMDSREHHSEWLAFEVAECVYNRKLHTNQQIYLNTSQWIYLLSNIDLNDTYEPLWVIENEICHFDQSSNVCTSEVF